MAASHVNIGNVLDDMGNPEEALVELKKGLDEDAARQASLCV